MTPLVIVAAAVMFGVAMALLNLRGDGSHHRVGRAPSWPVVLAACLLIALIAQNLMDGALVWVAIDALLLALLVLYVATGRNRAT